MNEFTAEFDAALRYARDHAVDQQLAASAAELGGAARAALLDHLMETNHPLYHVAEAAASGVEPLPDRPFHETRNQIAFSPRDFGVTASRYAFEADLPKRQEVYSVSGLISKGLHKGSTSFHEIRTSLPAHKIHSILKRMSDEAYLGHRHMIGHKQFLNRLEELHPELAE